MFTPCCLPILIGSLPLKNHEEAVRLVMSHTPDIPLWPQLPKLPKEGMIRQFIDGLPGLIEDSENFWVDSEQEQFTGEMALFYQDYLQECGDQPIDLARLAAAGPADAIDIAHRIKGSARAVGAGGVAEAAARIEVVGTETVAMARLRSEIDTACREISRHLAFRKK